MLFSSDPKIEELIVMTLARTPNCSAAEIRQFIQADHRSVSLQAIYQELKKLEKQGVISRQNKQYSLGLYWVLELTAFADTVYDRYTQADVLELLPEEGQPSKKWKFNSIEAFLPFWSNALMCMVQESDNRDCFEYMDHIWFHLNSSATEDKLLRAMEHLGTQHYLVVGGDSFLDRQYKKLFSNNRLTLHYGQHVPGLEKENYLSCVGDYILRIRPRKSFLSEIEAFQNESEHSSPASTGEIVAFLKTKSSFSLTLENSPPKARKIRKRFADFFGLALA